MAIPSLPILLLLSLGCFALSEAAVCPASDLCIGATEADSNGCCPTQDPDCCDRGPLGKYCHVDETDSPCCSQDSTLCFEAFPTCTLNKNLCAGKCCSTDTGLGTCCGNTTCCQYSTSTCRGKDCVDRCTRKVDGVKVTKVCKEPKICCKGYCVDPVKGDKNLPCKGKCCNTSPATGTSLTDYNGICCKDTCCTGDKKCCKDKSGSFCGSPCGKDKCCRGDKKCCGGQCVDLNTWCEGNCCTGSKAGACCGNQCCPKPAVCCDQPFPGNFFFGTCCKACNCGATKDQCCPL